MPKRSRFQAPRTIDSFEEVQRALRQVQESLDEATGSRAILKVNTQDFVLITNTFQRASAPPAGISARLPSASGDNLSDPIIVHLENMMGNLTVFAAPGQTVNGLPQVTFSTDGVLILWSNGVDAWSGIMQVPAESPAAIAGPVGPPGMDGLPGEQGEQGYPGAPGAAGSNGAAGADGRQGPPGQTFDYDQAEPAIIPGPAGSNGAAGANGADGRAAFIVMEPYDQAEPAIIPGPAGAAGATGATGAQGAAGVPGADLVYPDAEPMQLGLCTAQVPVATASALPFSTTTETGAGPFNDYAIPDLSTVDYLLVVNSSGIFTGFSASGGNVNGSRFRILSQSGQTPSLAHLSGASLAANTISCPDGLTYTLAQRVLLELEYFSGDWRVLSDPTRLPDVEVTIATTGNLDLTFTDVPANTTRLTLTGAAPVLRSIEGGTDTGRELRLYYNGSGTCDILHSSATGASGNESRIFNPENVAANLLVRQSLTLQANGTLGWRSLFVPNEDIDKRSGALSVQAATDLTLNTASTSGVITLSAGSGLSGEVDINSGGNIQLNPTNVGSTVRSTAGVAVNGNASYSVQSGETLLDSAGTPSGLRMKDSLGQAWGVGYKADARTTGRQSGALTTGGLALCTQSLVASDLVSGSTFEFFAHVTVRRGATAGVTSPVLGFRFNGAILISITAALEATINTDHTAWIQGYFTVHAAPSGASDTCVTLWGANNIALVATVVITSDLGLTGSINQATNAASSMDLFLNASATVANVTRSVNHAWIRRVG